MANWHVRALMERREEYESKRYTKDFDLVMAIAVHIGKDDSPAVMSIRRIAELAGCSYNLADIRTKALAREGKLVIGPSETRLLAYNLPFRAEREPEDEPPPSPGQGDAPSSLYAEVGELREMVGALTQTVKDLHAIVSQSIPNNIPTSSHSHPNDFPMDQREIGNKVGKKGRREEEELNTPAHEGRGENPFPYQPNPAAPPDVALPEQRALIIAKACNLDLKVPAHRSMADWAAAQLANYQPEHIAERYLPAENGHQPDGWNWWRDYWLGAEQGKPPTAKQLVDTIALPRPSPPANGRHPPKDRKPLYEPDENGIY